VFKITPSGTLTGLCNFCPATGCPDGERPNGGLALNTDGNLYGMTDLGGTAGVGTVFKITPGGVLTTLFSFGSSTNASEPLDTLVRASNGNFYGMTQTGGTAGDGEIFKITEGGAFSTVHAFIGTDGILQSDPAALVQATDGNFYGVASNGSGNLGTVFKMTPGGAVTVLHDFSGSPDGAYPDGTLVQGTDGSFYGTTSEGGTNSQGTVFKITPGGMLTILHSFGGSDGFTPVGGLVQATDGNFYGTTEGGGTGGAPGTVFQITPAGALVTLHNFSGSDGSKPFGGLVQHTNGTLYGTTVNGGASDNGTVFSLSMGLGPFVKTLPTSAAVGKAVIILGGGLTSASAVNFNGTPAAFQVISSTEITTTVPVGGTTGFVTVTTSRGTLSSNVRFRVP
jgi:uncharacterized repeat protein (TIGR03803 family)